MWNAHIFGICAGICQDLLFRWSGRCGEGIEKR